MPDLNADAVVTLVNEVKRAVLEAQQRPGVRNVIKVTKVDLELKSTFDKGLLVGGKFSWLPIPIELSGKVSQASTQTISMSLVPEPARALKSIVPLSEELADTIELIAKGTEAAAKSSPIFGLSEATASINIGTTKEGKIVVFVGREGQSVTTHTIKLTLQRA